MPIGLFNNYSSSPRNSMGARSLLPANTGSNAPDNTLEALRGLLFPSKGQPAFQESAGLAPTEPLAWQESGRGVMPLYEGRRGERLNSEEEEIFRQRTQAVNEQGLKEGWTPESVDVWQGGVKTSGLGVNPADVERQLLKQKLTGLASRAGEGDPKAIRELEAIKISGLTGLLPEKEQAVAPTSVGKLISERSLLPKDSPLITVYDKAIAKETAGEGGADTFYERNPEAWAQQQETEAKIKSKYREPPKPTQVDNLYRDYVTEEKQAGRKPKNKWTWYKEEYSKTSFLDKIMREAIGGGNIDPQGIFK